MTQRIFFSWSVFTIIALTVIPLQAYDLGNFGKTYVVSERDALDVVQEKASQFDFSKEFHEKKVQERLRNYQPKQRVSLPNATESRVRLVDVSEVLSEDVLDGRGGVL